ncbi:XRE family transcriptional regulator [Clostridium butyricum]|nr:XRE family transcriptional regulator [Clostridium butyricum]NFB90357.1 XRE family transcriptional regulator [Clostridium butyricum]
MCLQYCLYELVIFIYCKHYVPCCTLIIHSKTLSITQLSDYIRQWRRTMIRSKRREIGLSQSELARRIRKNKSYVSRLERKVNNYHPSMDLIKKMSKELKCCPIELFIFFADIDCEYFKK